MNPTSLTRHLLLKDFRHQRGWLALVWLYALFLPFIPAFSTEAGQHVPGPFAEIGTYAFFLPVLLVVARLVLLDAPGRQFHFLATKPVAWTTLLAGKILFIGLFLLVPILIANAGIIHTMKIPVDATDVVLILMETTIYVGALLGIVLLASLFLRSLSVIFVCLVVGSILVLAGNEYLRHRFYGGKIPHLVDWPLEKSQSLMFYMAIIATIGVTAMFRYRCKSVMKPLIALMVGLLLSLAVWNFWPYNLSRLFPDKPISNTELPPQMKEGIKLTLTGVEGRGENGLGSYGIWNHIKYINFNHEMSLEGVKPPYFAVLVDYHAEATLKSGRIIRSSYADTDVHGAMGDITEAIRQQVAGFPPGERYAEWNKVAFQIFQLQPDEYQAEDTTGVNIKGVLTLEIRRAFIVKTMPFKAGGAVDMPRLHCVLTGAGIASGKADFEFVTNSIASTLRGDFSGWSRWGNITWLVFNRGKGECLSPENTSGGGGMQGFFCNVSVEHGTLRRNIVTEEWKENPLPADWGDNAEISFFSSVPCGRISLPYEIKSIDLPH